MTEEVESEVRDMCNLSRALVNQGIEQGIEQGMKQGVEKEKLVKPSISVKKIQLRILQRSFLCRKKMLLNM